MHEGSISSLVHWTGSSVTFLAVFLVLVVWFGFCLVCCFVLSCLFAVLLQWNRDGCWTMYRFHTNLAMYRESVSTLLIFLSLQKQHLAHLKSADFLRDGGDLPCIFSEFLSRRPSRSWSRVPSVTLALSCVITSHPRSFSRPVLLLSHHFSCYTALSTKCFVVGCYALMACSMWSLGSWLGGSLVSAWCCVASLSRPRGSVGIAAFLTSLTDCRWWFDSPRWSASKTQDRRPAERQRARTKKTLVLCCFSHTAVWQCDFGVFVFPLFLVLPTNTWDDTMLSPLTFVVQSEGGYVYAIIR